MPAASEQPQAPDPESPLVTDNIHPPLVTSRSATSNANRTVVPALITRSSTRGGTNPVTDSWALVVPGVASVLVLVVASVVVLVVASALASVVESVVASGVASRPPVEVASEAMPPPAVRDAPG
nr:hypothetical protein GCM10020241_05240 [Streptoalloteichus tenebrarius]